KSLLLLIREDYFRLTKCDKVLSALLAVFEYWANGEISKNPMVGDISIDLGIRTIAEIEQLTLWSATDKHLRTKVKELERLGFISTSKGAGNHTIYTLHIDHLQRSLDAVDWSMSISELRSQNPARCCYPSGLLTEPPPVNRPNPSGLLTEPPPVNRPNPSGLLTEPLYIEEEIKNLIQECVEEAAPTRTQIVDLGTSFSVKANPQICGFALQPLIKSTEDLSTPAPDKNTTTLENQNLQLGECSAPPQFSKKMENLVTQLDRGEIKDLPTNEKKQLANYLMSEQIKLYRRDGWILSIRANDISADFLRYVAWKELKMPDDLEWARNTVISYERDMTKWGQLVALVQGWRTVTPEEVAATASSRVASRRGSKEDLEIAIQSSIDAYKTVTDNPFRRKKETT
ncbi:hypothetical protein, partial [Nostoc sp.]